MLPQLQSGCAFLHRCQPSPLITLPATHRSHLCGQDRDVRQATWALGLGAATIACFVVEAEAVLILFALELDWVGRTGSRLVSLVAEPLSP